MTEYKMTCLRLHSLERQDRHRHCHVQVEPCALLASGQFILFMVGLVLWMSLQAVNAMDADDGSRTATKIPLFSGKKAEFAMWIMKLTAVATISNYSLALCRNVAADGTVTCGEAVCPADEATATAAELAALADPNDALLQVPVATWKRNNKAFATLALALPKSLFHILIGAHGITGEVMQLLYAEYMPQDRISHIEADHRYDSIRLDEHMHPRYLHSIFAQIEAEYPHAAADEAKKMSIIFHVSL
jgi:hypothetical protein